jgi:hypothetical protein
MGIEDMLFFHLKEDNLGQTPIFLLLDCLVRAVCRIYILSF